MHRCDLMVKPFEWEPKEQRKMQHWEKCMPIPNHGIEITWTFHNFCSKESSICRQHIFNYLFCEKHWTPGNKFRWNIDKNASILIEENALKMSSRPNFSDHILHFQWNQVNDNPRVVCKGVQTARRPVALTSKPLRDVFPNATGYIDR